MYMRDLQKILGGDAVGEVNQPLTGVGTIRSATSTQITFLANQRYRSDLSSSRAGAVIVGNADRDLTPLPRLVVANPYACFARAAQLFNPPALYARGIHPSAIIHANAQVAESASVAEYVSIGRGTVIGEGARIGPGCILSDDVWVGAHTCLVARVTIYARCTIGARGIVHAGAVIGADGFGFAPDFSAGDGGWVKIPQVGRVVIGDDCEIGANTSIDRGAIDDTVVGNDVKIDNQVQVGHNCVIGDHTIISGCVGIAGTSTIGRRVMMGGGSGVIGHLEICDDAIVSAMTLVTKSITEPGMYTGSMPLMKHGDWLRNVVHVRRLGALADAIKNAAGSK